MSRIVFSGIAAALLTVVVATPVLAQTAQRPTFATTKVDGTDNVYIFRYENHQSMFVVTKAGVIATDPISLRRPAAKAYIEEIRKVTQAPIKYVIYSHSHSTTSLVANHSRISVPHSSPIKMPRRGLTS